MRVTSTHSVHIKIRVRRLTAIIPRFEVSYLFYRTQNFNFDFNFDFEKEGSAGLLLGGPGPGGLVLAMQEAGAEVGLGHWFAYEGTSTSWMSRLNR